MIVNNRKFVVGYDRRKRRREMRKKISIKSRLTVLVTVCCLIPMAMIGLCHFYYINSNHFHSKILQQITQLKYHDRTTVERFQKVIQLSRAISYEGEIISGFHDYEEGKITEEEFLALSKEQMSQKYGSQEIVDTAKLWFLENPDALNSSFFRKSFTRDSRYMQNYWEEDGEKLIEFAEMMREETKFCVYGKKLYLVRNVYDLNDNRIAVLALKINQEYGLERYASYERGTSVTMYLDDFVLQLLGTKATEEEVDFKKVGDDSGYMWKDGILRIYHEVNAGIFHFTMFVRFDDSIAFKPFLGYETILLGIALCLIPMLLVLMRIFSKHVSEPIEKILSGAEEIKKGKLGYTLDYEPQNKEFQNLTEAFNHMSKVLKNWFDHIYEEELALRDAKIMALQSHLNPHFMNNTLEIINWEARLSGNEKVSQMIGALATIMNAGIDRKHEPEVTLSQEMSYVDAYLYIISERFGNRLKIVKEIPDEIMDYMVPRLIIQPILENAVEYGAGFRHQGTRELVLRGYSEGEYLYLEIINEGKLDQYAKDKIRSLLQGDYDRKTESSGSMGITNVHQRLRILYGEPCGLKIIQSDENHVCARLIILASCNIERICLKEGLYV